MDDDLSDIPRNAGILMPRDLDDWKRIIKKYRLPINPPDAVKPR